MRKKKVLNEFQCKGVVGRSQRENWGEGGRHLGGIEGSWLCGIGWKKVSMCPMAKGRNTSWLIVLIIGILCIYYAQHHCKIPMQCIEF